MKGCATGWLTNTAIKGGLDKAQEAFGKAEGQLISGKGNLVKQVGEFKNLAPAIRSELPEYFTEKAALEIDFVPMDEPVSNFDGGLKIDLVVDTTDLTEITNEEIEMPGSPK